MKHGSIVWYNDGSHPRRFLFVTFLDNGEKARILDLDSGELIPRVVDAAALILDDTDNGPDKICAALDKLKTGGAEGFSVLPAWMAELNKVSEGQSHTLGAYYRPWK